MENNSITPAELEMNKSTVSTPDMRDWEVFDSDIVLKENLNDNIENMDGINRRPSGLFVHESSTLHSGIEELLTEPDALHHNESNTSSDIDVIDECIEENLSNESIPLMDISFSSSEISGNMSVSASLKESVPEVRTPIGSQDADSQTLIDSAPVEPIRHKLAYAFEHIMAFLRLVIDAVNTFHGDRMSAKDYFVIGFVVSLCLLVPCTHIALHKASWQEAKLEQMEGHMNKLLTENEHLKSKVLEKIESGKILGDLDEEVKDLRSENSKLHKAMQIVIHQLEEQTQAIRKGLDSKENVNKHPFKKEIYKLNEQINLLRLDNEELQKELVRIRYGKPPSYQKSEKKKSDKPDISDKENSSDDIKETKEEIKELHRKLDEEVQKLKTWKESLEELVKEMEKSRETEDAGEEERKFKHKEKKNRKFYNWSWKDIKKNVKGTFQNFPNMISNYVLFDKKNVDNVFNTISHYYKKAHDKTKKILDSYSVDEKTQNVKNDIWTLMGEMKNKWINMKNDFIATHFEEKDDHTKGNDEANFKKSNHNQEESQDTKEEESETMPNEETKKIDDTEENKAFEETMQSVADLNELIKEAGRRFTRHKMHIDNWLFNRAQHRADLRENEEKIDDSDDINWFLRKSKSTENSEAK